jgi:exodeoxyribonuclease V alpha subunit
VGWIVQRSVGDPDSQELVIEFDDKPVEYQFGELDEVALAYAVSIHKS